MPSNAFERFGECVRSPASHSGRHPSAECFVEESQGFVEECFVGESQKVFATRRHIPEDTRPFSSVTYKYL